MKTKRPDIETLQAVCLSGGEIDDAHFEVLEVCEYALKMEAKRPQTIAGLDRAFVITCAVLGAALGLAFLIRSWIS